MRLILFLSLTILSLKSFAGDSTFPLSNGLGNVYSTNQAVDITTKALLKEQSVKNVVKRAEHLVWSQAEKIGIDEGLAKTTFTVAAPLLSGKLSTKPMNNFKWKLNEEALIRPNVDYYFHDGNYSCDLSFSWRF